VKSVLIISAFLLLGLNGFGQIESSKHPNGTISYEKFKTDTGFVRTWYFDNGEKNSESILDNEGTWISYKDWSVAGELVKELNFLKERLEKGPRDLSFLKWKKLNKVVTIITDRDSSSNIPLKTNEGDTIVFHYRCLDDLGYEYANSIDIDEALVLIDGKNRYLDSFTKAIKELKVGDKAYIRIPSELGYKDVPAGNVPPNTNLVYYVDILDLKRKLK
jgi:hypothetical protein